MHIFRNLTVYLLALLLTFLLIYFLLKSLSVEQQQFVQPGWNSTILTGTTLLNYATITILIITIISHLIYFTVKALFDPKKRASKIKIQD